MACASSAWPPPSKSNSPARPSTSSPSRTAWPCWSNANAPAATTAGSPACSRRPLRLPACVEDLDFRTPRGLDRSVMLRLASADWVRAHQVVLVVGPTGAGKTYLSCALGQAACRQGLSTRYFRLSRLLGELALSRADGSYPKLLAKLGKTELLILDDWGLAPLADAERRDLLEVLEDRYGRRATLVTSQLPLEHWHEYIGSPTLADAILDRLLHGAHKLILKGGSMRKLKAAETAPPSA